MQPIIKLNNKKINLKNYDKENGYYITGDITIICNFDTTLDKNLFVNGNITIITETEDNASLSTYGILKCQNLDINHVDLFVYITDCKNLNMKNSYIECEHFDGENITGNNHVININGVCYHNNACTICSGDCNFKNINGVKLQQKHILQI